MYVYIDNYKVAGVYTVGYYDPAGNFHPESDYAIPALAVARVRHLNGGDPKQSNVCSPRDEAADLIVARLEEFTAAVADLEETIESWFPCLNHRPTAV